MDAFDEGVCGRCDKRLDECLVIWFDQHFRSNDGGARSGQQAFAMPSRLR